MITWKMWLIAACALGWIGVLVPMLVFGKVIVWLLAAVAFGCFMTGSAVAVSDQNQERKS